jgi:hypothetical protein
MIDQKDCKSVTIMHFICRSLMRLGNIYRAFWFGALTDLPNGK